MTARNEKDACRTVAVLTDAYVDYARMQIDVMSDTFSAAGYRTLCFAGGCLDAPLQGRRNPAAGNEIYRLAERCDIAGVLAFTAGLGRYVSEEALKRFLDRFDVPVVSCGMAMTGVPSVRAEEERGMRDLMAHLLEHDDRQKLAFLRGVPTDIYSRARESIFRECLKKGGRVVDEELFPAGHYDAYEAYNATLGLLRAHPEVDTIVAANDLMALSAARAAASLGFRIPDDIAITGFDDSREATQHTPALTTVRKPSSEIAKAGANQLLEQIDARARGESPRNIAGETELHSVLVVRRSTPSVVNEPDDMPEQRIYNRLLQSMRASDQPVEIDLEDVAASVVDWIDTRSCQKLSNSVSRILESKVIREHAHWVRDLCYQIELLTQDYLDETGRPGDIHAIRGVLSSLRESLWADSLALEFQVNRMAQARSSAQVQLGACSRIEDMLTVLDGWLADVCPERFYLVQYDKPSNSIPAKGRLLRVAVDGRVLACGNDEFDTAGLLPAKEFENSRQSQLIFYPVLAGEQHHGYMLIEAVGLEQRYIDEVAVSLGNAMRGQFLIRSLQTQASSLRLSNDELTKLANFDPLTGLPNRRMFERELKKTHDKSERESTNYAVAFLDLDGFKLVNDTLGHEFGDLLLVEVATRLKVIVEQFLGTRGLIARLAGDEFTILIECCTEQELSALCSHLIERLRQAYDLKNHHISVTASIGYAISSEAAKTTQALLRCADAAMYDAKALGKNRYMKASKCALSHDESNLALAQDLRDALDSGSLVLHYQPRVDLVTQRICGVEALMRWFEDTPLGCRVKANPDEFIPVAEKSGLIFQLGIFSLFSACRQARLWVDAGTPLVVSVNLSVIQLQQTDFVDLVLEALSREQLDAGLLELEITESVMMSDVESNILKLEQLREYGVRISLDDFGTGYSSLSYLKRLPVSCLKVDRSFIRDIQSGADGSAVDAALVRSITALAQCLECSVVAEGIETQEQRQFAISAGIDEGQGYYFAAPQSAEAVSMLLRGKLPLAA